MSWAYIIIHISVHEQKHFPSTMGSCKKKAPVGIMAWAPVLWVPNQSNQLIIRGKEKEYIETYVLLFNKERRKIGFRSVTNSDRCYTKQYFLKLPKTRLISRLLNNYYYLNWKNTTWQFIHTDDNMTIETIFRFEKDGEK